MRVKELIEELKTVDSNLLVDAQEHALGIIKKIVDKDDHDRRRTRFELVKKIEL